MAEQKVIDQLTKEKKYKSELYCVVTEFNDRNGHKKTKRLYYTSKEAYEEWERNDVYRIKCIDLLKELLGYNDNQKLPTVLFKKMSDVIGGYDYEALYLTILTQSSNIQWALSNKDFKTETIKISYVMAILQNNIMSEWKELTKSKKINDSMSYIPEDININNTVQKTKNISKFLED